MKVEEAVETSPPEELTEKRVVVAPAPWRSLWTRRGDPALPVRVMRVRRLEVVVVAAKVIWESEAAVVVPAAI